MRRTEQQLDGLAAYSHIVESAGMTLLGAGLMVGSPVGAGAVCFYSGGIACFAALEVAPSGAVGGYYIHEDGRKPSGCHVQKGWMLSDSTIMKIILSRLSFLWLLLFGAVALAIAAGTHSEYGISWSRLAPAVLLVVAIQWITWEAMAWARRKFRERDDPRASILIAGAYCAGLISIGMYYVERWRLANFGRDRLYLPVCTLVGTIVAVVLLSFRKGTR